MGKIYYTVLYDNIMILSALYPDCNSVRKARLDRVNMMFIFPTLIIQTFSTTFPNCSFLLGR